MRSWLGAPAALGALYLGALWAGYSGSILVLTLAAVEREFGGGPASAVGLGSILALGAAGAVPLGLLADRRGRKWVLVASIALFSVADAGSAQAPDLVLLSLSRAAAVAFETVGLSVITALVVEQVETRHRGAAVSGVALGAGLGFGLATLLYPLDAPHWRWMFQLASAGVLLSPLVWWLVPESSLWERSRPLRAPVRSLVSFPWRRRTLVSLAVAALAASLYRPAALVVAAFGAQSLHLDAVAVSAVIVVSGIVAAPSFVAGGAASDVVGRRWWAVWLGVANAVCTALTFTAGVAGYWVGNLTASIVSSAQAPVVQSWYAELFPTRARATAESLIALAGAVGGVLGLQAMGLLTSHAGQGGALLALSLLGVVSSLLLLALPETGGKDLPR